MKCKPYRIVSCNEGDGIFNVSANIRTFDISILPREYEKLSKIKLKFKKTQ